MSTQVITFLSRCPDRVFTHFFVLVHRQATLPSSEILAAEGRAPCKVYQVAYLHNQHSEDARRAIARAQQAPRGRRVRLDLQRVLPARLRRARDPLHAALASFQTRGGSSDGTKAGSILIREGVATKRGQPEPQLDQGRAQKELQGRRKNAEKGGYFSRRNHQHPQSSFQARRAGREVPWPSRRSCSSFRSFAFCSFGEQFAEPRIVNNPPKYPTNDGNDGNKYKYSIYI